MIENKYIEPYDPHVPVVAGDSIQEPADIEALRAEMQAAPHYSNDAETAAPGTSTYQVGFYPAHQDTPGRLVGEMSQAPQIIEDAYGMPDQLNTGRLASEFHTAYSFEGRMMSALGPAFQGLGFAAHSIPTDQIGSRLVTADFPSPDQLTTTLEQRSPGAAEFVAVDKRPTPLEKVTALASGQVLVSDTPTGQVHSSLFQASVWALLPPEVMTIFKAKAAVALDPTSQLFDGRFEGEPNANVLSLARDIDMVNLLKFGNTMAEAAECTDEKYYPSPIDWLGFELNNLLRTETEGLDDNGRALAEATVRHIRNLSA